MGDSHGQRRGGFFTKALLGNPLVYCGTAGIMPKDKSFKKTSSGELVVVVAAGPEGETGFTGATFSSGELTHESEVVSSGAVQIGNPIQEKKVLDALLQARTAVYTHRDYRLRGWREDCLRQWAKWPRSWGCRVDLEKAPLKYKAFLREILDFRISERMVISVKKEKLAELMEVFDGENVEARGNRRIH